MVRNTDENLLDTFKSISISNGKQLRQEHARHTEHKMKTIHNGIIGRSTHTHKMKQNTKRVNQNTVAKIQTRALHKLQRESND